MNRPARRKSSLTGANPAAPAEPATEPSPDQPSPEQPESDTTTLTATETTPSRPATSTTRSSQTTSRPKQQRKYPHKVSFYQDAEDTSRVRGAILHTMVSEGSRSLSQFIDRAVMAEVERLEAKYNGGKPFPPVAARELPQGRPMGE